MFGFRLPTVFARRSVLGVVSGGSLAVCGPHYVAGGMGGVFSEDGEGDGPVDVNTLKVGGTIQLGGFTVKRMGAAGGEANEGGSPKGEKGAHHRRNAADGTLAGGFVNPWPSARDPVTSFWLMLPKLLAARVFGPKAAAPETSASAPPLRPVDFGRLTRATQTPGAMALTWLGHAAFLLSSAEANVLLDPCLSDRCSPLSFAGPKRVVQPPCSLDELDVDVVVISHNHYDHLDLDVLKKLHAKNNNIVFFVPLGNKSLLTAAGISNIVECDWWDSFSLSKTTVKTGPITITCTPCQHFSSRTAWDRNETLWSSWHLATSSKRFFFGGDTGYRSVFEGETEEGSPTCPAFREVRARFGDTDLSALPIGAYEPRHLFSPIHCNPNDAIDVHLDLGSKKSVAMHWGTFPLGFEGVMEPPIALREAMKKRGLKEDEFLVVDVGETVEA
ncbi:hypothetical protein HK100_011310 [Physocladia obscura]|uniref:Metallo-beta-lactamase domain-containing protein n=1 Tax=Physocladia obscura TaxID=109957 RepID=A0AAD5XE85_9FUNG|nr:hypothetical protein HK100_011310 [Physocladia obscura]